MWLNWKIIGIYRETQFTAIYVGNITISNRNEISRAENAIYTHRQQVHNSISIKLKVKNQYKFKWT